MTCGSLLSKKLSILLLSSTWAQALPEEVTYNAHIRSFLSDKCIACHGPDSKKREADLRLDTAEGAYALLKDKKSYAIVPGKPDESHIFARIDSKDEDIVMPPPHFHKKITSEERELLKRWIEQGAKYEPHWAYTPIKKTAHESEAKHPIDGFIRDRLKTEKLKPSPRANHAALIRRLSLDITGIPPKPEDISRFEEASAVDPEKSYLFEVNRLLESPHYGERMAVPWLDAVRFASTVGYHGDQNMSIFPYRDYVINAFNTNKSFKDFVTEQLAGDLLENPTDEQLIASGFNRLNLMTREGGVQPPEYIAKYAADRVRAVGTAFLGQTTGCAECHDHKFDPISAKDFYSLAAFFDDVKQWGVYRDYAYSPNPELKGWDNHSPFSPELAFQSPSLLASIERQEKIAVDSLSRHKVDPEKLKAWLIQIRPTLNSEDGWAIATPTLATSAKNTPHQIRPDHSVEFLGTPQKDDLITLEMELPHQHLGAIRIQALPGESGFVGRGEKGTFLMSGPPMKEKKGKRTLYSPAITFSLRASDGSETLIDFDFSRADLSAVHQWGGNAFRSKNPEQHWLSTPGRWEYPASLAQQTHSAVLYLKSQRLLPPDSTLIARIYSADIARLRISITPFLDPIPGRKAIPESVFYALKNEENPELLKAAYHYAHGERRRLPRAYQNARATIHSAQSGWTRTLISMQVPEQERRTTRILPRGDWQQTDGEIVQPAVFHFLPSESLPKDRRLTRLDLANWITADENPLTARHFTNRLWKQFFGTGLSNVLNDLGAQGEWPSHPKLLDWLAADFRDSGWDVKNLIRTIVTSQTYQQQASFRSDLVDIDPQNRLYAQQAARRLDAEFIRDNALSIADLLDTTAIGGRSMKPYQPAGYYAALNFPTRKYHSSGGQQQYRRGVYMHIQRTFLHPMLANFDAPTRVECSADRLQANSPQQALTQLNDPTFVEAARVFAVRLLEDPSLKTDEDRIKAAYLRALARSPRPEELTSLQKFLTIQRENLAQKKDDPKKFLSVGRYRANRKINQAELAAMSQLCRVILNLHETITRY